MKRILFVCTGNTCRSPMAEGFARKLAREESVDAEFRSAGVSALDGHAISEYANRILMDHGISESFTSHSVSLQSVQWADLILTMTEGHKRVVIQQYPEAVERIFTLKEYVEDDPEILEYIVENEQLVADVQLKQALGQEITNEERSRLTHLQRLLPNYDISDPFGRDLLTYQQCANELEVSLRKLIQKISVK